MFRAKDSRRAHEGRCSYNRSSRSTVLDSEEGGSNECQSGGLDVGGNTVKGKIISSDRGPLEQIRAMERGV